MLNKMLQGFLRSQWSLCPNGPDCISQYCLSWVVIAEFWTLMWTWQGFRGKSLGRREVLIELLQCCRLSTPITFLDCPYWHDKSSSWESHLLFYRQLDAVKTSDEQDAIKSSSHQNLCCCEMLSIENVEEKHEGGTGLCVSSQRLFQGHADILQDILQRMEWYAVACQISCIIRNIMKTTWRKDLTFWH